MSPFGFLYDAGEAAAGGRLSPFGLVFDEAAAAGRRILDFLPTFFGSGRGFGVLDIGDAWWVARTHSVADVFPRVGDVCPRSSSSVKTKKTNSC